MTKTEIMKEAHRIAREELEGDYQARLSLALKKVWKEVKQVTDTIELEIERINSSGSAIYISEFEDKEEIEKFANKYDIEIDYTLEPKIDFNQFFKSEHRKDDYINAMQEIIKANPDYARVNKLKKTVERAKKKL